MKPKEISSIFGKKLSQIEQIQISLPQNKKIYFASDFHLGTQPFEESLSREKKIVRWLDEIKSTTAVLFLVGDIFDFWFEYKHAIPKGGTRLLGKIAEFTDSGIPVHIFTGNHDIWMFDYLEQELNVSIHRKQLIVNVDGKTFFVAHGDGLGPNDKKFKRLKKIFTQPFFQWCFKWLHPDIGILIARLWSNSSKTNPEWEKYFGEDKEWLILYAKRKLEMHHFDYFVFVHRHLPLEIILKEKSVYFNLGDWMVNFTYLIYDGNEAKLARFMD